jgi:hypothetical protein
LGKDILFLNVAGDVVVVTEALIYGFIRLSVEDCSEWDMVCLGGGLICGVVGLSYSGCDLSAHMGGGDGAKVWAYPAVGFVFWGLGSVFREWSYFCG